MAGAALVAVVVGLWTSNDRARAQSRDSASLDGPAEIHFHAGVVDGFQQIIVFNVREQTLAVYEVGKDGKIAFKSSRKCLWDLQLDSFNADNPLPDEIRSELQNQPDRPRGNR
jgi:hypothetical protein